MEALLSADIREKKGKGNANRLRAAGRIPSVLYGKENNLLSVDASEAQKLLSNLGTSHLITLQIKKGKKTEPHPVLIKEVQFDPIKRDILHLDFYEVSLDHKVHLKIPVVLTGQEERENDGSLIEQHAHEVEISCLPTEIPEKIEVNIANLKMNDTITLSDLTPPKGVEFVTSPEETIVTAVAPRVEAEPAEEAEETVEEEVEEAPAEEE